MADLEKLLADANYALASGVERVVVHLAGGITLTVQKEPFPRLKHDMPATEAVSAKEGGEWIPFKDWQARRGQYPGKLIHSITFANGHIWDAQNGWRPPRD